MTRLTAIPFLLLLMVTCADRALAQDPPDANAAANANAAAAAEDAPRKWPKFGIAIGAGVREILPADASTSGYTTPTPILRFIPRNYRQGFIPAFRLGLGTQRTTLIANGDESGSIFVRPLTAGIGYAKPVAQRLSMVFSANGRGRPRLTLPASVVGIDNSFAWELSSRAWLDLNPRVSLVGGIAFLATHPELTLVDGSRRRWNASQLRLEGGIAFTVLKPLPRRPR
jgi:hypothetical protein